MRFSRFLIIASACGSLLFVVLNGCDQPPEEVVIPGGIPGDAWKVPIDVSGDTTQNDWLELGWQSFIALSWPADTGTSAIPGQPNTTLSITAANAASLPTVWDSYLTADETFLPQGANPGAWTMPAQPRVMKQDPQTGKMIPVIGALTKGAAIAGKPIDEFDEAGVNRPLIDQNSNFVLFEVMINQAEFQYLSNSSYYNADSQKAAFKNPNAPTFKSFPDGVNHMPSGLPAWAQFGATEIKASWRILETDPNSPNPDLVKRYYTQRVFYETPDNQVVGPVTVGLVGLHILRLTPSTHSTWFWATFEQVDNVQVASPVPNRPNGQPLTPSFNPGPGTQGPTYANGYSYEPNEIVEGQSLPQDTPVNVSRVTPIPSDVQAINTKYQQLLSGTVWQYYQMVNTLNPDPNGPCPLPGPPSTVKMNACEMVNTSMETYTQVKTNCNSCHAFAFPQGAPTNSSDFQVFTFLLKRAQSAGGM